MKGTFLLVLLLEWIHQSNCCDFVNSALFCTTIPTVSEFPPGVSTMVISVRNAGEINSTVFHHDNLESVTSVIIRGAGISGIAEGAFRSFLSLTSLTLDQNELMDINHKWLGRPSILTELSMSKNNIGALSGAMLREFTNLRKLNLNRNRINTVQTGTFTTLTALAHLDLSDNNLTQLTSQMFSPLHNVNMSLQGNPWVCSCDTDFIKFIVDLKSRSLLLHAEDVTCASPPGLRGHPVSNITVCNAPTLPNYPFTDMETARPSQSVTNAALTTFPDLNVSKPTRDIKTTLNQTTMRTFDTPSIVTHQPPPHPASDIVPMLITIIVVLCVVLLLVIILAVVYRKKRNRKIVAPKDQSPVAAVAQAHQKTNMRWDLETPCQMPFTAVRAQSANAILFTSPFGVSGDSDLSLSKDKDDGVEDTDGMSAEGGQNDSFTSTAGNVQNASSPVGSENVPYLSIGSCPNEPSVCIDVKVIGPGAMSGWGLHRISTWPTTAVQWQERCKQQREHEEGENVQPSWTQEFKVPSGLDKAGPNECVQNETKVCANTAEIQWCDKRDERQKGKDFEVNMSEHAACSISDENNSSNSSHLIFSDSLLDLEQVTGKDHNPQPKMTTLQGVNVDTDRAGTSGLGSSKRRGEVKRSASNAPSSGVNEYVFMNLLHEVVQNRGRWTRDRWRQIHMGK